MTTEDRLHGYYRSTAAWRVRIALNLKGLQPALVPHHLRRGEQRSADYLRLNPQGLLPALEIDGAVLTQSLAIIEYLDETHPQPRLLPTEPLARARVRALALAVACDIHPVQNLRVLQRLRDLGASEAQVQGWARDVIEDGLAACAVLLEPAPGPFCFGQSPTLADLCLIPQLFNARRFAARTDYGRLPAIETACMALPAFTDAHPDRQADAE